MWRVILDERREGTINMGIDEALLELGGKTLRIYGWKEPTVTIGRLQKVKESVDLEECRKRNIKVIRRISGGGSVLHDREITYCIVGNSKDLGRSPEETFSKVLNFLVKFLEKLGIEGAKEGINDISVKGKKISGNAQARRKGRILQHGTILLEIHPEKMDAVITPPEVKMKEKGVFRPSQRITSIREILGYIPGRNVICEAILEAISETLGEFYIGSLSDEELSLGEKLAGDRYGNEEWLLLK